MAGVTGSPGVAANQLLTPTAITFGPSNELYVSARDSHRVQKWLSGAGNGTTVAGKSNGTSGSGLSELNKPTGIAVDSNSSLFVADLLNHRVVRWNSGATSGILVAGTGKK